MIGLEYVLIKNKMTGAELANRLGITRAAVSLWISSKSKIPEKHREILSEMLDIHFEYLKRELSEEDIQSIIRKNVGEKEILLKIDKLQRGSWEVMYEKLVEHREKTGGFVFPKNYEDRSLIGWVQAQRRNFREKTLSQEHKKMLEDIGFVFVVEEYECKIKLDLLIEYKKEFMSCSVPYKYIVNDVNLGKWVCSLKQRYKNKNLDEATIVELEKLGFDWHINEEKDWQNMFDELKEYKNEFGNCVVPIKYVQNDIQLGNWVSNQRHARHRPNQEQIDMLNVIGFIWSIKEVTSSKVVGVALTKYNKWAASITVKKERTTLGIHLTEIEAIRARRDAEIKYLGKSEINLDDFKDYELP